jgi:hypothetical protein
MRLNPVVRIIALAGIAVSAGWWLRGADTAVMAERSSSGSDAGLGFQLSAGGPQSSLTVYNPANHTLYVYPRVGVGSSSINCEYSLTVNQPGAPIQRQNCPVGDQVPRR